MEYNAGSQQNNITLWYSFWFFWLALAHLLISETDGYYYYYHYLQIVQQFGVKEFQWIRIRYLLWDVDRYFDRNQSMIDYHVLLLHLSHDQAHGGCMS